jgi:hypothetical protein
MVSPAKSGQHAPADAVPAAAARRISTINPATGLSTDYLNHFTEAVMTLEMGIAMPDCLEELRAWRPKTYREHFAASQFAGRDAVIAAYEAADPAVRNELDGTAQTLNAVLLNARDTVLGRPPAALVEELARRAVALSKPLIARAASIINGTTTGAETPPQSAVDALFSR